MPDTLEDLKDHQQTPDRRYHPRHQVRSLAYIELDEGNGGILLNVGESGLAVQAVMPLMDEFLPQMRLQLSMSSSPISAVGQIVWTASSRKVAGIRFLDFPPEAADQIREWIASEAFPLQLPCEANFPHETRRAVAETTNDQPHAAGQRTMDAPTETQNHVEIRPMPIEPILIHLENHASDPAAASPTLAPAHAIPRASASGKIIKLDEDAASEISALSRNKPVRSNWLLYVLIAILAVCSTAAGWSVGRTGLYGAIEKLRTIHSAVAATVPVPASTREAAKLPGIEIIDLNNRRWVVPFIGSTSDVPPTPRSQPVASIPPGLPKTHLPGRAWTLASPVRAAAAKPDHADSDIPPALSNQVSGMSSSGTPLAAIESGSVNISPPVPVGLSQPSPGVVQPAELIHRVEPIYPASALKLFARDETIRVQISIGPDGQVQSVKPVSGSPLFFQAAVNAIRQWRYRPAMIDGKAAVSGGEISVVFRRNQ